MIRKRKEKPGYVYKKIGKGLMEQMHDANTYYYRKFSVKDLEEALKELQRELSQGEI